MKKIILSMLLTLAPAAAQAERIGAAQCRIDTPAKVRDEGTEIHLKGPGKVYLEMSLHPKHERIYDLLL